MENEENVDELIQKAQKIRRELASNIYQDFFMPDASQRKGNAIFTRSSTEEMQADGGGARAGGKEPRADENAPRVDRNIGSQAGNTDISRGEREEDPMQTLNALIGLSKIKHDVRELADFAKVRKARIDAGLKAVPVSLHLVFTGNPGTGKTTVARIIGRLYKQIGVLSKGQLVEVDRSGLVAGYVGQTAIKTTEQIGKALGGVLFIDEAYALSQKMDDFGKEAVDTILKAMEDHRDDLVVIVAGYTEPMKQFIDSNPGLKSRFNKYFEFPDYTLDELMDIFDLDLKKYDYTIGEETRAHVRERLSLEKFSASGNFANARAVRNIFEEIITNQARRVARLKAPSLDDLKEITNDDLSDPEESCLSGQM